MQSRYFISINDPYLRFPSWASKSPAGVVGGCPFTTYYVSNAVHSIPPPPDTSNFKVGVAVVANDTWELEYKIPPGNLVGKPNEMLTI